MSFLSNLPHQIPFRAASAARVIGENTIEGLFLWTANETLPAEPMLLEAMAQFGGGLAFREQAFFTGADRCEIVRAIEPGDVVTIRVTLEAEFGGTYRFSGVGEIDGVEVARARFYLANAKA